MFVHTAPSLPLDNRVFTEVEFYKGIASDTKISKTARCHGERERYVSSAGARLSGVCTDLLPVTFSNIIRGKLEKLSQQEWFLFLRYTVTWSKISYTRNRTVSEKLWEKNRVYRRCTWWLLEDWLIQHCCCTGGTEVFHLENSSKHSSNNLQSLDEGTGI